PAYYPVSYSYPSTYYYWAAPTYACVPAGPAVYSPMPAYTPYAQPRPAPPSGTPEPPLQKTDKRGPKITESRYADEKKVLTQSSPAPAPGQCRVGFWNLTGRDVTLTIDGQTHTVKRNRALTLDLSREFEWRMNEGETRTERVPADRVTHEIVLRRN